MENSINTQNPSRVTKSKQSLRMVKQKTWETTIFSSKFAGSMATKGQTKPASRSKSTAPQEGENNQSIAQNIMQSFTTDPAAPPKPS